MKRIYSLIIINAVLLLQACDNKHDNTAQKDNSTNSSNTIIDPAEEWKINKANKLYSVLRISASELKKDRNLRSYYDVTLENSSDSTITDIKIYNNYNNSNKTYSINLHPKKSIKIIVDGALVEHHLTLAGSLPFGIGIIRFSDGKFLCNPYYNNE